MIDTILFSHESTEWGTPQSIFKPLNDEYHFTIDVAASPWNTKCKRYYDKDTNGLIQSWAGEVCWCNPPYGNNSIWDWVSKAASEAATTVILLPSRTDTKWFHDLVIPSVSDIIFIKGRIKFEGAKYPAPFPSLVAVFDRHSRKKLRLMGSK